MAAWSTEYANRDYRNMELRNSKNVRVEKQAKALESGDFEAFKALVVESGFSSYMYNLLES